MQAMTFPAKINRSMARFHRMDEAAEIAQSVRLILTTRPGERPLRPEFGADLWRFAFENMDTTTRNLIRREVLSSLSRWEPRIDEIQVSFGQGPEGNALLVGVEYEIIQSGEPGRVEIAVEAKG